MHGIPLTDVEAQRSSQGSTSSAGETRASKVLRQIQSLIRRNPWAAFCFGACAVAAFLVVFIALTLVVIAVEHSLLTIGVDKPLSERRCGPSGVEGGDELRNVPLSEWMRLLDDRMRLTHVSMPGSHDAGTQSIGGWRIITGKNDSLEALEPHARRFMPLRSVLAQWGRTHHLDVFDQLCSGARLLDLRIAYTPGHLKFNSPFRIVHAQLADETLDVLDQVVRFTRLHPSEFVIVQFNHHFNFDPDAHARLRAAAISKLGSALGSPDAFAAAGLPDVGKVTLGELRKTKLRVIVTTGKEKTGSGLVHSPALSWDQALFRTDGDTFANSGSFREVKNRLNAIVPALLGADGRSGAREREGKFFDIQAILTPTAGTIAAHAVLFGSTVGSLTPRLHRALPGWARTWREKACAGLADDQLEPPTMMGGVFRYDNVGGKSIMGRLTSRRMESKLARAIIQLNEPCSPSAVGSEQ